jgi:hypothetical protein
MYRYALRQSASVPRFLYPAKGYGDISLNFHLQCNIIHLFHNCLYRFSYFSISAVIMDFAFDVSSAQYSPSRRYTGISSSVRFKSTTVIRPSFSNAVTSILSVYLVTPIRCAPAFRKCVKCHMVPAAAVFLNVTADILCPALPVFRL